MIIQKMFSLLKIVIGYLSKWYGIGNDNTILYTQILGKPNVLVLMTHARRF